MLHSIPAVLRAHGRRHAVRSLSLAAGVFLASPALALTYYVGPGGSDANTGTSSTTRFATIGKANAVALPGDVVRVSDGTYSTFPRPAVSGSPGARITYVGNLARPDLVRMTDADNSISRDHVTIKGFALTTGFDLRGTRDSIAYCQVAGSRPQINAANDCVVAKCAIDAERFWVFGTETDSLPLASRDTIVDCTVTVHPTTAGGHSIRFRAVADGVFLRCRFNVDIGPAAIDASATKLFFVRRTKFVDCSWDITNRVISGSDEAGWFVLRDVTQFNRFERDTIVMRGPGQVQFFGAASGTYPQSVMNNNFEGCVWKMVGPNAYNYGIYYQDAAQSDTLLRCVVVSGQSAIGINGRFSGSTLIEHCTFASFSPYLGAFSVTAGPASGTLELHSNIFYTAPGAPAGSNSAPLYADVSTLNGRLASDHNLFYSLLGVGTSINAVGVGTSAPGRGYPWHNATGADANSISGAPLFVNASSAIAFDAHLAAGSAGIGAGRNGEDAGAYAFGAVLGVAPSPLPIARVELAMRLHTPTRGALRVELDLPSPGPATLDLLDVAGRRMATREVGSLGPGHHAVTLGEGVPPGIYLARIQQGSQARSAKAVFLR